MSQLTIFDALSDVCHEVKPSWQEQKISMCIETYSTKGSKRKYYRLSIMRDNRQRERYHIRGGSTISKLANYRKQVVQALIDRGAPPAEIIAQVTDWR